MNILTALLVIALTKEQLIESLVSQHKNNYQQGGSEAIWINPTQNERWGIPFDGRVIYTNPDFATQTIIGIEQNLREASRQKQASEDLGTLLLHEAIEKELGK